MDGPWNGPGTCLDQLSQLYYAEAVTAEKVGLDPEVWILTLRKI